MSNYTKTVDFAAKDTLPSGDSGKIIKGTEFETEFDNISTAIATKADSAAPTFTGTSVFTNLDINGTVQADGAVTVGVDDTGYDVKFFGATAGKSLLWDESADTLIVTGDSTVSGTLGVTGEVEAATAHFGAGTGAGPSVADEVVVSGTSSTGLTIHSPDANNATLAFGSATDNDYAFVQGFYNSGSPFLRFSIQNSEKVKVTSTGIDVTGSVTADGLTVESGAGNIGIVTKSTDQFAFIGFEDSTSSASSVYVGADGNDFIARANSLTRFRAASNGDISFYNDAAAQGLFWDSSASALGIGTTTVNADLHLGAASPHIDIGPSTGNRGKIGYNTNNVYIGSTSGTGEIHFKNNIGSTDAPNASGDTKMVIADAGVGIGTDSPTQLLNLESATSPAILITDTTNTTSLLLRSQNNTSTVGTSSNHPLVFETNATEVMRLDAVGNAIFTKSGGAYLQLKDASAVRGAINVGTSDGLVFTTGSSFTEAMRIDSSGNLGIGTSAPAYLLHLEDSNGADLALSNSTVSPSAGDYLGRIYALDSGDNFFAGINMFYHDDNDGEMRFRVRTNGTNTDVMTLVDGNVGIGGTPTAPLHVFGGGILGANLTNPIAFTGSGGTNAGIGSYTANSDFNVYSAGTGDIKFVTGAVWSSAGVLTTVGSEAMRIDASGNLLVGRTDNFTFSTNTTDGIVLSPSRIDVSSASLCRISQIRDATGTYDRFYNGSSIVGSITGTASATAYNTSSDQRLKENIADADDAGSKIDAIQVRKFDWKADGSHQDYGMVAQELLEVAPESVSAPEDPEEMMGVDYSKLVPMMLKEIQSLRARVAQLES